MVIVVNNIRKNNFAFELTVSVSCYVESDCEGEAHIEKYGCCGKDGTNPNNYKSVQIIFGTCYPVVCK